MRSLTLVPVLAMMVALTGCETIKVTWNQQNEWAIAGGANAVVPVLDYTDTTKDQAAEFATALIAFIDKGEVSKQALRDEAAVLAEKLKIEKYESYINALIAVLPSETDLNEKIPEDSRVLLVSALKNGTLAAIERYDESKKPVAEEGDGQ